MSWWYWRSGDGASTVNILTDVGRRPVGRLRNPWPGGGYYEAIGTDHFGQPFILADNDKPIEINASELKTLLKFGVHIDIDQRSSK